MTRHPKSSTGLRIGLQGFRNGLCAAYASGVSGPARFVAVGDGVQGFRAPALRYKALALSG